MLKKVPFSSPLLSHRYEEVSRIHIMTFHKATRDAYDDFLALMTDIYQHVTPHDQVRLLIDYRQSGIPPIHYLLPRSLAWARSLKIHPEARLAAVTRQDALSRLLRGMTSTIRFGHLSTGIFEGEAGYDEALQWLQRER